MSQTINFDSPTVAIPTLAATNLLIYITESNAFFISAESLLIILGFVAKGTTVVYTGMLMFTWCKTNLKKKTNRKNNKNTTV